MLVRWMQTLPVFKKDLTSLGVHSFKHSPTSKMLSASKLFLKYCFFMRYNAGRSCCCPFPSFNPLLASRHTKNKKKVTTRFMRLYLPWPQVFPSTASALAICTEHQTGQRSSTSGLCNYYSFHLECSSQRNSTDRIVHFSTSSRCVFVKKCLHPPQIPMLKLWRPVGWY